MKTKKTAVLSIIFLAAAFAIEEDKNEEVKDILEEEVNGEKDQGIRVKRAEDGWELGYGPTSYGIDWTQGNPLRDIAPEVSINGAQPAAPRSGDLGVTPRLEYANGWGYSPVVKNIETTNYLAADTTLATTTNFLLAANNLQNLPAETIFPTGNYLGNGNILSTVSTVNNIPASNYLSTLNYLSPENNLPTSDYLLTGNNLQNLPTGSTFPTDNYILPTVSTISNSPISNYLLNGNNIPASDYLLSGNNLHNLPTQSSFLADNYLLDRNILPTVPTVSNLPASNYLHNGNNVFASDYTPAVNYLSTESILPTATYLLTGNNLPLGNKLPVGNYLSAENTGWKYGNLGLPSGLGYASGWAYSPATNTVGAGSYFPAGNTAWKSGYPGAVSERSYGNEWTSSPTYRNIAVGGSFSTATPWNVGSNGVVKSSETWGSEPSTDYSYEINHSPYGARSSVSVRTSTGTLNGWGKSAWNGFGQRSNWNTGRRGLSLTNSWNSNQYNNNGLGRTLYNSGLNSGLYRSNGISSGFPNNAASNGVLYNGWNGGLRGDWSNQWNSRSSSPLSSGSTSKYVPLASVLADSQFVRYL